MPPSMLSGRAYSSIQLHLRTLTNTAHTHMSSAETIMTKKGIQPTQPVADGGEHHAEEGAYHAEEEGGHEEEPHFSSLERMRMTPFSIFLPKAGTRTVPGTMPSVMTQAMAAKTSGSVMRLAEVRADGLSGAGRRGRLVCKRADDREPEPGQREAQRAGERDDAEQYARRRARW